MSALFDRMYADLHAPVLSRIRQVVLDPQTAEDVSQDVWERMALHLDAYALQPGFNPRALIYTTATNRAIDHLRRGQSVAAGGRVRYAGLEAAAGVACSAPGPELVALAGEGAAARRGLAGVLLEALPHREHTLLWWVEYGRRTYQEVARRTDSTVPAVKAVLYRTRRHLDRLAALEAGGAARGAGVATRFLEFVDRSGGPNACWPWHGAFRNHPWRHPSFRVGGDTYGTTTSGHRVAFALRYGPIPPGVYPLLTCGSERDACANPAHLAPGRKAGGGVGHAGGRFALLTPAQVRLAYAPPRGRDLAARRQRLGLSQLAMTRLTGIDATQIWKVEAERDRYGIGVGSVERLLDALDRLERAQPGTGAAA